MILTHRWTSFSSKRLDKYSTRKSDRRVQEKPSLFQIYPLNPLSFMLEAEFVIRAMSRKKAVKGKGSSRSPKASPSSGSGRTGKGLAVAAAPSSGLVYPSRPSISNSGEFYDIAFKVSWQLRFTIYYYSKDKWHILRACLQLSNQEMMAGEVCLSQLKNTSLFAVSFA